MPHIEHNDLSLYYETHGSGQPLLMVAGLASDSQSWQNVIPSLSARFQVIVFDNRGVGRTQPMNEFASIANMANDCVHLLDFLGIAKAHVLGHSMGGFIAQKLAICHPERISSLILAGTTARISARINELLCGWAEDLKRGADKAEWLKSVFRWLFTKSLMQNPLVVTAAIEYALNYPYPQSYDAFANQVKALAGFDSSSELSKITVPSLVIAGKEDILFSVEEQAALARGIASAKMLVIPHAAHSIHIEQSEAFCQAIFDFLLSSQERAAQL